MQYDPLEWPAGTKIHRQAVFVYEVARMQAFAVGAPVVPEAWSRRDDDFKEQFIDVIEMMMGPDRKTDPEELHNDWWVKYREMGWTFAPERNVEKKTHPDMVPYGELALLEQIKDAVFVALCEVARQFIF